MAGRALLFAWCTWNRSPSGPTLALAETHEQDQANRDFGALSTCSRDFPVCVALAVCVANGSLRFDTLASATLVAVISLAALVAFQEWEEWINFVLGVWISLSPWILGFQHTAAMFVNLTVGILIAYLAMLELWLIHYGPSSENTAR